MMSRQRAATALVPVLLAMGCPRPRLDLGPDGAARSSQELLKRVDLAESAVVSVRGEANLAIDGPQGKGSTALFVEVAPPNRVHLEQLDFFGRPQSVLVSDGERFGFYDGQAARYFRGPASRSNLERFVPIALPLGELVAILLGRVPRMKGEPSEFRLDERRGVYALSLSRDGYSQVLEVQPSSSRIVHSAVTPAGAAYGLELSDVRQLGGATFPFRVRLVSEEKKTTLELKWKSPVLNQPSDPALFEAAPPEGVPVIEIDGEGQVVQG